MHSRIISVIGLGYVGLPLATAFSKKGFSPLIAFDIKKNRIESLQLGYDETGEVSSKELQREDILFTSDPNTLKKANFHIISVPTPIDSSMQPNLSPLKSASRTIGEILKYGDVVVYESTVYPGATEEVCIPILEETSGLISGRDFSVGYSPERINPGDKEHNLESIVKIVSGQNKKTLKIISKIYSKIVKAGIYEARSIRIAEAAKVIENSQRDINIAFINELKIIFDKMDIDIHEVLEAAKTKWNFLDFYPGLVGGHCIGVDPYYLTYKAQQIGYHPEMILSGRRINDGMGKYFAEQTIKSMIGKNIHVCGAKIGVLGVTFKENCSDIRNTKVVDIVSELKSYCVESLIYDPLADKKATLIENNIVLRSLSELKVCNVFIIAVSHKIFACSEVADLLEKADLIIDIKNYKSQILDFSGTKNTCEA